METKFVKTKDDGRLIGQVETSLSPIHTDQSHLYRDQNGKCHVIQDDRHEVVSIDLDQFDLVSWEQEDGGPETHALHSVVKVGHRYFWYVEFGTDMINMLCAKDEHFEFDDPEQRNVVGRAVFDYLTE